MRLLVIGGFYHDYLAGLYGHDPARVLDPYAEQLRALQDDAFGWAGAWTVGLRSIGYEVQEIYPFVTPLERAWVQENRPGAENMSSVDIAVEQARTFLPDVVLFDHQDRELLHALRAKVPSLRLVLGWEGSALSRREIWCDVDLMLCCAPESVDILRRAGVATEHIDHAFSPHILPSLSEPAGLFDVSFFGQIIRSSDIHLRRERLLEALVDAGVPIRIFSPSANLGWRSSAAAYAKMAFYATHQMLRRTRVPKGFREMVPFANLGDAGVVPPRPPMSTKLAERLLPPKYGIAMYQAIRDSSIVLNIHADSSPTHASNMRLFEITGAGACMLVDNKQNMRDFFEPEREVVMYDSAEDCAEKARWLLDHPKERAAIAAAGQRRTLSDHTFARRAPVLDRIIRSALAAQKKAVHL